MNDRAVRSTGEPRHSLIRVEMVGDERQRGADPQDDREKVGEFAGEAQQ